ncbi:MAG: energy-coupling factor transporter transmembrane protein EcfT, partial [Oscillospiraceae bacterium]|nr:energy-coupling factor transporter transmembrane protein EcfT [Oscillospiraceae bacterium]
MLKDITIGQYFPMDSAVHRLDARFKIVITAIFIVMIFTADSFAALCLPIVFFFIAFGASKLSFKLILKSMKSIIPVIILTSLLNIFFIEGVTVFEIFGISISDNG